MKHLILILFLIPVFAPVNASAKLRPFTSDGCSSAPDGVFSNEFLHCCMQHDLAYWKGGSEEQRLKVDETFYQCMKQKTEEPIAELYYNSVRIGGNRDLQANWAWGYGWSPLRASRPHTPQELQEIQRMTPNLNLPIPINKTYPTEPAKILSLQWYVELYYGWRPDSVGQSYKLARYQNGRFELNSQQYSHDEVYTVTTSQCPRGYYLADLKNPNPLRKIRLMPVGCPALPEAPLPASSMHFLWHHMDR